MKILKQIVVTVLCAFVSANAWAQTKEQVDISAPIIPRVLTLYPYEGANFPATLDQEQQVAHDASLIFDDLLNECQPLYPDITLWSAGDPALTPEQLATNYDRVAECSYALYTAKPYWIPQLVDDVDICGAELGSDWRLISESDLATLDEADYQFLQDTLTGGNGFYFSLQVFVRANDGTLMSGSLVTGIANRVTPLPSTVGGTAKYHLEAGLALRCIRRTAIATP
jgi:hypothetical protein